MIEYDNRFKEMTLNCDHCAASIDLEGEGQECVNEAKDEDWFFLKDVRGEWEHFCPACRQ